MVSEDSTTLFGSINTSDAAKETVKVGRTAMRNQDYESAIRYFENALAFVGTPPLFKARVHEYRGECYWLLSQLDAAEADYLESLNGSDDKDQIARARVRLGEIADFRGQYVESEKIYQQALLEATAVNNLIVIGRARRGLGIINRRTGNTELAIRHLTQALAAFREAGAALEQARVLTSLGRTRHARGEYQLALSAHQESLKILESLGDKWRIVQALNDLGECHQALYDVDVALEYHQQALRLGQEYGAELIMPEIKRNLGIDLIERGEYEKGLNLLQESLVDAVATHNHELEALSLYQLARAYLRRGDVDSAAEHVASLHYSSEILDVDRYRALASFAHGELLYHQGKREEAVTELNSAMLEAQTSVDRGILWKLHATISYVVDNDAIAAVHRQIAADFICQTAEPLQDERLKSCFVNAPPVLAILQAVGLDPKKI